MRRRGVVLAAAALLLAAFPVSASADFAVDDLADDLTIVTPDGVCDAAGALGCTLREALNEANANADADTITFSVSGTIHPVAQFTTLNPTTIDGNGSGTGTGDTVIEGDDTFRLFLVNGGAVTFKDLRLEDGGIANPVGDGGAAIRTANPVTLANVVATSNQITGTGGGTGGAILATTGAATLTLTDTIVSGNTIGSSGINNGGGISTAGDLGLDRSVVTQNSISAGTAQQGGGLMAAEDLSIDRSTIVANSVSSGGEGGGIFTGANAATRSISNSTISGNQAPADGGGGMRLNSSATLTNLTLANNGDGSTGAGDDLVQAAGTATARNSIFASSDPCLETGGSIVSASPGHNLDEGTSCGFGDTQGNLENTDPMFSGGLNMFGGGQQIIIPLWNSPAIDGADPTCGGALATDQRGRERPQGPTCDVGAYERDYRTLSASRTGTGSGSVTGTGISCGGDCEEMFVDGTQGLVLTATPSSGSQFASWIGCDSVAGSQCTVDLGNDRAVTASFSLIPAPPPTTNPPPTTTTKKKKKCKKKKSKGRSAGPAKKKKCKKKKK